MNIDLILDPAAVRKIPGINGRPSHPEFPKPARSRRPLRRRPKQTRWR